MSYRRSSAKDHNNNARVSDATQRVMNRIVGSSSIADQRVVKTVSVDALRARRLSSSNSYLIRPFVARIYNAERRHTFAVFPLISESDQ
ncbi:hypothetical protein PsorP6_007876 [Peronosclerospora sorghi]|uniref:Uncharacterized protein n=1 Tax=Peronosclerospora sorghi TaxID=230839 RepID=A0ACC0WC07_9STRA|nr:hypothetical protein PsorP6_007876 [Peronosclerospora sorghi]